MIKAYAAHEKGGKLEYYEYDEGPLAEGDVEIKVEYCGLCHSDLSMLNNEWGMTEYPFVPGHEVIGKVIRLGAGVDNLKIGQAVGLGWHSSYCLSCHQCQEGDHNLCSTASGTIIGRHGGFADKVRAQSHSVVPLPDGLDPVSAGPLFCGGITVFNPLVQFNIPPTAKVGVIGIGGLGHIALQFLKAWGCEVTAFTSTEAKRAEAIDLGAHYAISSTDKNQLNEAANNFDLIISTVNVKLNWNRFVATLKPKGRLHFVGATLEPLDISVFPLISSQRSISGSPVGSPAVISKMLAFAKQYNIKPVVEQFSFDEVNEAIAHLESGKARYRVVLSHLS